MAEQSRPRNGLLDKAIFIVVGKNYATGKDRRKAKRCKGDEFLMHALRTLLSIERRSRGEQTDYTEDYVDMVGLKTSLGRRAEDHRLGELMCSTIEAIAENIDKLNKKKKTPRVVKITKTSRKDPSRLAFHTSIGWEAEEPCVGKSYRIYSQDGGIFYSAPVTKVATDHFQTQNSLYRIEVLRAQLQSHN